MTDTAHEAPGWRAAILAVLVALIAGASGLFAVPPLDRDESRFVQATTQMVETGDYVRVRYQDLERNKKPAGIHWLQAASAQVLGGVGARAVWTYRVPSLIGMTVAVLATYLTGCLLFGRRPALIGALLLASAPVVMAEASIAKTDAALLGCVAVMQLGLARAWVGAPGPRAKDTTTPALFWLALAAGVLIKGPIAPMIAALTAAGLRATRRDARWLGALKPRLGLAVLAVLVLPWFVAIGFATEGRFYAEAIGTDMLGKVGEAQESHAGPFGYHALVLWAMFWPAGLFLPVAFVWTATHRRLPGSAFCLAWALPSWLVFEAAGTKLPHYAMVLYPALALLAGAAVAGTPVAKWRAWRWAGIGIHAVVGLVAAGGVIYLLAEHQYGGPGIVSFALAGLVAIGVIVTGAAARTRPERAAFLAVGTSVLLGWVLFQHALPRLDELAVTPRLAATLDVLDAHPRLDGAPPVALVGYHEPSAVFELGTETLLTDAADAADWLRGGAGRTAVIEARHWDAFAAAGPAHAEEAVVAGINYSNGDDVRLIVVRAR